MTEPAVAEEQREETFEDFFHVHYERLLRTMYLTTDRTHARHCEWAEGRTARTCLK